ncbi:MAG: hypothetical protein HY719_03155, partial [Planctomycetes bacterium]|nr:hypothetical protein [Planctomycetota bacterium]
MGVSIFVRRAAAGIGIGIAALALALALAPGVMSGCFRNPPLELPGQRGETPPPPASRPPPALPERALLRVEVTIDAGDAGGGVFVRKGIAHVLADGAVRAPSSLFANRPGGPAVAGVRGVVLRDAAGNWNAPAPVPASGGGPWARLLPASLPPNAQRLPEMAPAKVSGGRRAATHGF